MLNPLDSCYLYFSGGTVDFAVSFVEDGLPLTNPAQVYGIVFMLSISLTSETIEFWIEDGNS